MKRYLILFLVLPTLIFSQHSKKYPSLLWKISGKGLKTPSYLYGTMHVSNRVAYHLSEQFFDALKSVDVVGLETNPGEWLQNMEKTGELSQINQFSNPYLYNQNFYKSTFSIASSDKRLLQGILSYDPDIINGLLYRHNRSKENFEENTYIDLFIFQSASKLNKQVISLEDFVESEIKARLSALPDEESEEDGNYKDFYSAGQKIEDAYRDGDLDMLDSLSKLSSTKNTQKYLINDRNVFFANTIDSVLKTKSLFSGVGAAHLPGEEGVIELLRKKGYTVEPLVSKNSKKSDQVRDQLDAKVKPVDFSKQFAPDSAFSVSLPGKLSQIVNLENVKYYINADMVNGSFYTIVRLKYFGPLFNISPAQMMQRVDSLLFEYIPGKTISKKEITSNNGLKGFEIINRTRRGDEQHYQIYFSELEMILFKLGGKQQYATSSEAKQFFGSIQFQNKNDNSIDFAPKTKGFSIKVPASYSYVKNDGSSVKGIVEDLYAYQKTAKQFYGVKHAVYNDFEYLEEDTFELNQFAKHLPENFNFKENIKKEITQDLGFPCLKISSKNKTGFNFYGKLYIKGVHYYLVYFISEKESNFNNDYFASFKITDFNLANPVKEISDPDFYFKAVDEVTDNSLSRFNDSYARAYERAKSGKEREKDGKTFDFNYRSASKSYFSPSSNEYINITYEKFNDYDYKAQKDFEDYYLKTIRELNSLVPTHIKSENKNGLYSLTTILKDTATRRAIDLRVFIKGGMRYEISAPFDTVIGLKNWTKGFMESFTLKDTVIGKNVFENKFAKLLDDLCSNDTTVRKQANQSLQGGVSMQKIYVNDVVGFINSKKIDQVNEDSKAQLFVNSGTLESEKIIQPFKNLYKQYTDSFYLQLCLLKGLAFLKTQNSYNAFYSLLMTETPLVGNDKTVSDVFSALNDSLELCKGFFPGILALTRYEEYRGSVYAMLASMVNKKIIGPAAYLAQKDNIIADANLALKRYNPAKPNGVGDNSGEYDYMDKAAKEMAENIQSSIDGLSNNNLYKGSDYLKKMEALNRPELVNYAFIISAWYKTDEKAKNYFARLGKVKAQNVMMPVLINLLKQNVVFNDTLINYYCKNKITRAYFFSELEKEKLGDKFNKKYISQESLVESVIFAQKQLAGIYSYEKEKKQKDSLIFVKQVPASNRYQKGKLYIYKPLRGRNEDESWAIAFVPDSKRTVNSDIEVVSVNYLIDSKKSEGENINEIVNDFYISFRKRAGVINSNLYFPGYN
ncbi:MAG: TraB/GumN family protein [Bacteroidetes bacterium]|nr:TraB/GumN family protein [Bacteroidota bacterium]